MNGRRSIIAPITVRIALVFVGLFLLSVPFPYFVLPDPGSTLAPFSEMLVGWSATGIFTVAEPWTRAIVSDSIGMYIHLLHLVILSILFGGGWYLLGKRRDDDPVPGYLLRTGASYYLSLQLLGYGFEKIFKHQFYLPEPNTLLTPLGHLSRDILYWSTIGSSHSYSAFTGLVEVIPALLLLFERTRLLGALGAAAVMAHVTMINVGFDISVKIFSGFLLLLAVIVVAPDLGSLYRFFILKQPATVTRWRPRTDSDGKVLLYAIGKGLVIGAFCVEALFLYFESGRFNDDLAPRPVLHGAYDVTLFVRQGDTIAPLQNAQGRPKRIFVHRRGYLIIQDMDDRMLDYRLGLDTARATITLSGGGDPPSLLHYERSIDSMLTLDGRIGADNVHIVARQIDLARLPLMDRKLHWTIDRYREP